MATVADCKQMLMNGSVNKYRKERLERDKKLLARLLAFAESRDWTLSRVCEEIEIAQVTFYNWLTQKNSISISKKRNIFRVLDSEKKERDTISILNNNKGGILQHDLSQSLYNTVCGWVEYHKLLKEHHAYAFWSMTSDSLVAVVNCVSPSLAYFSSYDISLEISFTYFGFGRININNVKITKKTFYDLNKSKSQIIIRARIALCSMINKKMTSPDTPQAILLKLNEISKRCELFQEEVAS